MLASVRPVLALLTGLLLLAGTAGPGGPAGSPATARADVAPAKGVPATVSADPLPTVQVDGVVWTQLVVGNRVYAGGRFSTARPAGARPRTRTVPRRNLLAYDIRTGALVPSFAPALNGQVLGLAASPDRSRVYVAGEFTAADGRPRYRLAAYSTATGALVRSFAPRLDYRARSVVVSPDGRTVFAGGAFTSANGRPRRGLAAFRAADGALKAWAPRAEGGQVWSMVLTPDRRRLVVGGQFTRLSGEPAYGMGAVDLRAGRVRRWRADALVRNAGVNGAITSLSTDGRRVYGTGYDFGARANFEGAFAADPDDGRLVWLQDCHGDTYAAAPARGVLYTAGHAHYCGNIGGFDETEPRSWHRALAFTTAAKGRVAANREPGYPSFAGQRAPALLSWWPQLEPGRVTGQSQAAWSVAATAQYVVYGGEFPRVNGVAQQGLVRFAVRSRAPLRSGPLGVQIGSALWHGPRALRVSWRSAWDRDDERLTYRLVRDGRTVSTTRRASTWWRRPLVTVTDRPLQSPAGRAGLHRYRLLVTDSAGNTVGSPVVVVQPPRR